MGSVHLLLEAERLLPDDFVGRRRQLSLVQLSDFLDSAMFFLVSFFGLVEGHVDLRVVENEFLLWVQNLSLGFVVVLYWGKRS